LKVKSKNFILS